MKNELTKGTQIIYVPSHAKDINHPDCEDGFVMSRTPDKVSESYFCRYWGKRYKYKLRTTANSEATHRRDLYVKKTRSEQAIRMMVKIIEKGYPEHLAKDQWDRYDKAMQDKYGKEEEEE